MLIADAVDVHVSAEAMVLIMIVIQSHISVRQTLRIADLQIINGKEDHGGVS